MREVIYLIQNLVSIKDIFEACNRINNYIRHTPLENNPGLSALYGSDIYLKLENLQVTGSFKSRGSFNKLLSLSDEERKIGVIAPSAGNHGIGLSYASKQLNIPCQVYLPVEADMGKVKVMADYGASITYFDTIESARLSAMKVAKERGYTFLSAYNDPFMIAASGTIGLEILKDMKDINIVITCLGGGGLTSGVCLALKSFNPNIQVWGVQTENSPTFAVWLQDGKEHPLELQPSIAEGLSGPIEPATITFPIIEKYLDRIFTVTEEELVKAMKSMLDFQYIIEPSGAAGIAALPQMKRDIKGQKVAVIVTGRNISWGRFYSIIAPERSKGY